MNKLNIGCGERVIDGYVGLDIVDYGQRFVLDVREGIPLMIPFELNEKWEQIRANHFLEHLTQDEAIKFLNDCHGICEELYIEVPHKDNEGAYQLTHKTYYTETTFKCLERPDYPDYGIKNWKIKKMVTNDHQDLHVWMEPV